MFFEVDANLNCYLCPWPLRNIILWTLYPISGQQSLFVILELLLLFLLPLDSGNLVGSISWPSTTDNGNNLICRCLPINIEELHFCITHVHHQDNHFATRHIHIQLARRPEKNSLIWIRLQRLQSLSCRQKIHGVISIRKRQFCIFSGDSENKLCLITR